MKKYFKGLLVLTLGFIFLTGCQDSNEGQSSSSESSTSLSSEANTIQATLKIENQSEEPKEVVVDVAEGTTLMEVMEENFEVEAPDGFIESIDGVAQDQAQGYYWTFTINGDWGESGAAETILEDGDEVVFSYGEV